MKVQLRPCPFCGSRPAIFKVCTLKGEELRQVFCEDRDCPVGPETRCDTLEEVVRRWNERDLQYPSMMTVEVPE